MPHITLKPIAKNPDIKEGMTREQIDAAIARHAETELLYDQPYEDSKRMRVTGPLTVESLSPYRLLSTDDIACWFIDTNYNGESFFVRHAFQFYIFRAKFYHPHPHDPSHFTPTIPVPHSVPVLV